MVNSVTSGIMVKSGHLPENMVFMELPRLFTEIYYYRTAKNQEVDFMVIAPTREKLLFQVCESIKNEPIAVWKGRGAVETINRHKFSGFQGKDLLPGIFRRADFKLLRKGTAEIRLRTETYLLGNLTQAELVLQDQLSSLL